MAESLNVSHHEAIVNGVRLHYVEAGEGSLVVLLHGYPEFWYAWRNQIPALVEAGFRVIAPDMRGYNLSEKPPGVRNYDIQLLAADVAGLIRHAGAERATVAGHDWGGGVAWAVPMYHPDVVEKLIVLNAPHPSALLRELRTPAQIAKSWYMFFFQLPWLPEMIVRAGGFAMLRGTFRLDPLRRGAFTQADIQRYVQAMAQPGAVTAAINYYRATFRRNPLRASREVRRVQAPTLLIWGEKDRYLGTALTRDLEQWVPHLRVECLPNASHWVQHDEPERVNALMIEFLRPA
jgi:epoxide hydrolase 4